MIFVINNLKYDTDKMQIVSRKQGMSLLVQYDLETYEKIFGEIEEA